MKVKFTLNSPPFSINKYHYARTKTRTQAARDWGSEIHAQLQELQLGDTFKKMREYHDPKLHGIEVDLRFGIDRAKFFRKDGEISRRGMDLTNIEKPLVDLIFDEKHLHRDGIPVLALDDKYITRLHSQKFPADVNTILIKISIYNLEIPQ